jgi:hypothetical protein
MSGRILGAHQKFDRVARKQLADILKDSNSQFPTIKEILRFEGQNGPDGIKRKSPAQNEPWHYLNPFDTDDEQLCDLIADHHAELVKALKARDHTKAAFEAAWQAHAIVDGLTPAHHYPYEKELEKLSEGQSIADRTTVMKKIVLPGDSPAKQVKNNWKMWGPKGLMSTHGMFEFGVATIIAPHSFKQYMPTQNDIHEVEEKGIVEVFKRRVREIAALDLYLKFYKTGWTPQLARQIRRDLAPAIAQVISLAWYSAVYEAERV